MKIFFITSKLNFTKSGGSIEEIDFIIKTLQKLGNDVTVVTAYSSFNHIPIDLPYRVITEQIHSKGYVGVQYEIFSLLRKYSPHADVFHIDAHLFMYGAGLYKLLGGRRPVVAFLNQFLTCWPQYISRFFPQPHKSALRRIKETIRYHIERVLGMFLVNKLDIFSFVSPTLKSMYEDFGLRKDRSIVIGDPIDFKRIMRENNITEDSYAKRNKKNGPIVLFYSSRMSPGKGFDMALKGFAKVKNKENYRLILGGVGPEEQYVREMVKKLGLEPYVDLPGWVSKEQLYAYYKTADIFIQADWWPAGTSISLLYAMAFGLPSILPGGGGLEWNAKDSALYFKYNDTDDIAKQIEHLGVDPVLRMKLSHQCYMRLADEEMNYSKHIQDLSEKMQLIVEKNQSNVVNDENSLRYIQWIHRVLQLFVILFSIIAVFALYKVFTKQLATAFVYLVFSVGGVKVCWLSLNWRPENQKNLLLIFISIIFSLYLSETLLPVVVNVLYPVGYKVSATYDSRSRMQVIDDFRKEGLEVYPYDSALDIYKFKTTEWSVFPLGSIARKKMAICEENGPFSVIDTDEYGFNNPLGLQSISRSPSALLLGDSFAMGECAPYGQDVGSLLRQQDISTINLGRGGDGPLLEFATFLEYAVRLKPKAVLWLYYEGNDLSDLHNELALTELKRYLDEKEYSQQLRDHQSVINGQLISAIEEGTKEWKNTNSRLHTLFERLTFVNIRGVVSKIFRKISGSDKIAERERYSQQGMLINAQFRTILDRTQNRVSSWGGKLFFVYLPSTLRYSSSVEESAYHRKEVLQMVENLGIPIIDFHQTLEQNKENWGQYFPFYPKALESHYTAAGYKLLSGVLAKELKK